MGIGLLSKKDEDSESIFRKLFQRNAMNQKGKALLLIGSAKSPHSNSESLGAYLLERLKGDGFESESLFLHKSLKNDNGIVALFEAVERADLIILASPLYIDSLPYLVTKTFELIAEERLKKEGSKAQSFTCIINCGFPEAHHTDTAIAICRKFAAEAGFRWVGGLGLGGGESLNASPLKELGGMVRNTVKSLDLTADALSQGKDVPQEAIDLMAKPFIPRWLYILFGGMGWKKRAKRYGAGKRLYERPYAE